MNNHPLLKIIKNHKEGKHDGIFSVCTSNSYVIESCMERLKNTEIPLLIESTANQVDQFGGYTGMTPKEFVQYIYDLCEKCSFPKERIILGGDHLGPLTWTNLPEEEAMKNSKELIKEYVLAGFTKIHIDTSMPINDDIEKGVFSEELIAKRAGILCKVAEDSYKKVLKENSNAIHPVYVIGSEVPIPGGAQGEEEEMHITSVEDFKNTITSFKDAFKSNGVEEAFDYVIGVVVQPGVEFSSDEVWEYNSEKAKELSKAIEKYSNISFEAHSTDYQTKYKLREMVSDGFSILKVGPALTFAFREGVFALSSIEEELFKNNPNFELSRYKEILDFTMVKNPSKWNKHYCGAGDKIKIERKFSYSDRCRYYMGDEEVEFALDHLINNLSDVKIPLTLVSQYCHNQYLKIREGKLENNPVDILKDWVVEILEDYIYAVK